MRIGAYKTTLLARESDQCIFTAVLDTIEQFLGLLDLLFNIDLSNINIVIIVIVMLSRPSRSLLRLHH